MEIKLKSENCITISDSLGSFFFFYFYIIVYFGNAEISQCMFYVLHFMNVTGYLLCGIMNLHIILCSNSRICCFETIVLYYIITYYIILFSIILQFIVL